MKMMKNRALCAAAGLTMLAAQAIAQDASKAETQRVETKTGKNERYVLFVQHTFARKRKDESNNLFAIYQDAAGVCHAATDMFRTEREVDYAAATRNGTDKALVNKDPIATFSENRAYVMGLISIEKINDYIKTLKNCRQPQ